MPLRFEWLDPEIEAAFKNFCEQKYGHNKKGRQAKGFTDIVKFFLDKDTQEFYENWKKTKKKIVFGLSGPGTQK